VKLYLPVLSFRDDQLLFLTVTNGDQQTPALGELVE
jgi:hypothetical protein